jgi:catechol 2,3-dioxygenase-like lactoylglutathione lyase family enzyme
MQIIQVLETCLYVEDLAAAEMFYDRVLGLELHSRAPGRHAFFRCGKGMFLLFYPDKTLVPGGRVPTHGAHGPGHVAFAVEEGDMETWLQHLQSHGIDMDIEIAWPTGGYSTYFRDPAGNSVELATAQTWEIGAQ